MDDDLRLILEQEESGQAAAAFRALLRGTVREALLEIVGQEVDELCGERYARGGEGTASRAGSAPSYAYVDGRREELRRPRVRRAKEGGTEEVALESWKLAQDPGEWEEAMKRAVLCGVSCRGASRLRVSEVRGESKSSLSRLWQRKAAALVQELQGSDLSGFDLLVLLVDGVVLCEGLTAVVAMGVDGAGNKRILGYRLGSSESAEACRDLLASLRRRGLSAPAGRPPLAVLDGSEALRKAVVGTFPGAPVQRCLVHKERNIRAYLPRKHWKALADLFKRLRRAEGEEAALEVSGEIEAFLGGKNRQALASLEEAGEDLLAVFRLGVPATLNVALLSTNAIENAFKNLRRHIGRVARWREETAQADLWVASGLMLAQGGFRRVRGHADLPSLAEALKARGAAREGNGFKTSQPPMGGPPPPAGHDETPASGAPLRPAQLR